MHVYAVTSQKGGVGKTTTTANLGAALAADGKRILLIDLDPQSSLTEALGTQAGKLDVADLLRDPPSILNAIRSCSGNMKIVASSPTLASVLLELENVADPARRLQQSLSHVAASYDYCLIDCPPSLGHATSNAMTAAHVALVPLQCEFLSLRGLADVREIAGEVQATTNPDLRMRVVATMFDKRTTHAHDVLTAARDALPGLVYETVIPRTVRLAEAPATGQTIFEYAPDSNGAYAYLALAQEILEEDRCYGTPQRHSGSDAASAYTRAAA